MIIETLKYCFHYISCPKYIRKLGLLSDLIGIESRYSRCRQAWKPHLENSRRIILETAQGLTKHERVIIFGAGSLHDVPLKELSESFSEVHLVDIFFLQATINEVKGYSNVEFHELDITGVLRKAYEACSTPNTAISELAILSSIVPKHFMHDDFDLVISLNLLSQLPLPIKNYLEKLNIPELKNNPKLDQLYQSLILNHLNFLRSFIAKNTKVLLISDTEKMVYGAESQLKASESSLEGLTEDIFQDWEILDSWNWDLAPLGELDGQYSLQLKIRVFRM